MLFTLTEIIYLIILVLAVGYIFSGIIRRPKTVDDILKQKRFDLEEIKYAIIIAAPAVLLHELAHKFTAIAFGLSAQFFIWPTGIVIGIILKLLSTGFIILAPGYVLIASATQFQSAIISLAGPLTNCIIWLGCKLALKSRKIKKRNTAMAIGLTGQINKWLFIFNMIPIPPLDGSKVLFYIISLF